MAIIPRIVLATPEIDLATHNEAMMLIVDTARWELDRIIRCSVVFRRESAYNSTTGQVDQEATAILLANNSLHYGRTVDVESFFVAYDRTEDIPIGIGFGSLGTPQSWTHGQGPTIAIPSWIPGIGGRRIVTFRDDVPLTPAVDARVRLISAMNMLPWTALEPSESDSTARRLYVSTPNHLFDFTNRNPGQQHVEQCVATGGFQRTVQVPSAEYSDVEAVVRAYPDESDSHIRGIVRIAAETMFRRPWLF